MLKNDYLVAKIGVDTAENELFQVVGTGSAGEAPGGGGASSAALIAEACL